MNKYKQTCLRHQMVGMREFNRGDVVRTVAISERDAAILNDMSKDSGFEYVLIEQPKPEPKPVEKTEKEIRADLFAEAEKMGLKPAKNIKTEELKKLVQC
jgi:hypothetical protein